MAQILSPAMAPFLSSHTMQTSRRQSRPDSCRGSVAARRGQEGERSMKNSCMIAESNKPLSGSTAGSAPRT